MNQPLVEMLTQLRVGNQSSLIDFYRENRDHFARWARQNHQLEPARAHDLLQLALVQFYDQVLDGRLTKLPNDLRRHLYELALQQSPSADATGGVLPAAEAGRRRRLVLLFRQLSSDSQWIMMYFYFRGYNFAKVAGKMGYPNAAVARRQKLSSLRTLYELQQRSSGGALA